MKSWSIFCLLTVLLAQGVFAVKKELFKRCDQSGFCQRNRHYAKEISQTKNNYYSIDTDSLIFGQSVISGIIQKSFNETFKVNLPFEIQVLENDSIRFKVDEDRSSFDLKSTSLLEKKRYDEAWKYAFAQEPKLSAKYQVSDSLDGHIAVRYGKSLEYSLDIDTASFQLTVSFDGEPQVVLNDRTFFNVEHIRAKDQQVPNMLPEETDFDTFRDSFKDSKRDTLPFGPESIAVDVSFKGFRHVYGIPEHADTMSLKDTTSSEPYRLYNVDIFEYETNSKLPMYGAIPLMVAHKSGLSTGLFWVNGADTFIDVKKEGTDTQTHWISENGVIDLVIFIAKTPQEITKNYAALTGTTQLPQLFSLGYHQCRWNYNDEDDVLTVSKTMDEYEIPYDVIWLDVEYTVEKKYFTWNPAHFPDPERMMAKLDETGRTLVAIIDPHLKLDYPVSDELVKHDLALKTNKGDNFKGHCWPGESYWIDTFNPKSQAFWNDQFSNDSAFGGSAINLHIWNDMNEPSVFSGPETTTPKDVITHGNFEIRSDHNIYGLTYHQATYGALKQRYVNKRPFILTRSYFAGSQRTAAMWTGDNMSQWSYLKISLPMLLTQNIVNMPFGGADVGGFFGDPSKELLTRWYQAGIWYPFFRAHAHIDSRRREPWIAGEPYTDIMRDAVRLRYRLLPLFYTKFFESSKFGDVVLEPLFYKFPDDESLFGIEDEFFVGGLLVKPVTDEGAQTVEIHLPDDEVYYDHENYSVVQGKGQKTIAAPLEKIPVFFRGGTITPRKDRYRRSSKLMKYDPYTLVVAVGTQNKAHGTLYIDDGETFNYESGEYLYTSFDYDNGTISGQALEGQSGFTGSVTVEKLQLLVPDIKVFNGFHKASVTQDGASWEASISMDNGSLIIANPKVDLSGSWRIDLV
ncbi:hypothetical protein WICPIJ_006620 [Wickerhamomyces pijperi]|uniref:Glycoside hydrolase family 31 N-terminal domain-containing protein n=2 Tax=Wickerhamomyces TaxID=599737 RepID=A0A9P8Q3C9_WICPI|nr:hypothetical protein WICPIJ_006620 [Wickerhamomyces pijperi]